MWTHPGATPGATRSIWGIQDLSNAGGQVIRLDLHQLWFDIGTCLDGVRTAGAKRAAAWRIDRRRHVALEHDSFARRFNLRVGYGTAE